MKIKKMHISWWNLMKKSRKDRRKTHPNIYLRFNIITIKFIKYKEYKVGKRRNPMKNI